MFQFPGSLPYVMDWRMDTWGLLTWVPPFGNLRLTEYLLSPQLIAACHVLRRLSVPRHPPCALYSLTFKIWKRFGLSGRPALNVYIQKLFCWLIRNHLRSKDMSKSKAFTNNRFMIFRLPIPYQIYSVIPDGFFWFSSFRFVSWFGISYRICRTSDV